MLLVQRRGQNQHKEMHNEQRWTWSLDLVFGPAGVTCCLVLMVIMFSCVFNVHQKQSSTTESHREGDGLSSGQRPDTPTPTTGDRR